MMEVIMELTGKNYVDKAEEVVKKLERERKRDGTMGNFILTTSKIRNILSMISEIYNDVIHLPGEKLDDDLIERLQYLRMRFAYEAGRETGKIRAVKNLIEVAGITELIKEIGDDKEKCRLFCRYMEAIVAYHKFYGGRD